MKRYLILLLAFITMAVPTVASAITTRQPILTQRILPLDCIFEEVNDGLGTLHYLTPEACGVIIPPVVTPPTNSDSTGETVTSSARFRSGVFRAPNIPADANPGESSGLLNVVLLNNIAAALQNGGYVTLVHVGSTFFYRPLDSPQAAIRSLTVTNIDANGITLSVQQLGINFHLSLGQARTFDRLKTSQPAVGVRLESIKAAGSATLRVQLLNARPAGERSTSQNPQLWLLGLLIIAVVGIRIKPHWFGGISRK